MKASQILRVADRFGVDASATATAVKTAFCQPGGLIERVPCFVSAGESVHNLLGVLVLSGLTQRHRHRGQRVGLPVELVIELATPLGRPDRG